MAIIGESFIAIRPLLTGFGAATKVGVDKELAANDVFAGISSKSKVAGDDVAKNLSKGGKDAENALDKSASHISSAFTSVGESLANWGIPFSGAVGRVGDQIDKVDTKGQKLSHTLSTLGGVGLAVGAVGAAAVAAESVHLASGLAEADGQIASHEDISVKAAANVGKAFESSAGQTIFSANQQAAAFAPVAGELAQVNGAALTAAQSLEFLSKTGDLAEATGGNLGSTTAAVASIMQGFQIPLKDSTGLVNDLFNTSRVTGVGVDTLGSTIDRLKARLGIAAPTVGDLSTLLVDLNEHGVQGSRGLQVVNSAITTLLSSVPKVSAATAAAANTLATKLTSAGTTAKNAANTVATAQENGAARVAAAQLRLQQEQERIAASSTAGAPTTSQQIALQNAQNAVTSAQEAASASVTSAQTKQAEAQGKLTTLQATAGTSTNAQVQAMQELGLQVYTSTGTFVGMQSIIAQLQPKLAGLTQEQQLATTSQIFGASASKALLATILAGPAAYDKAHKAVTDSSTAHKGAAVQNQNLQRQADILKATLVDEGDKLGTFLIPKLEDLAKWTEKDVEWFTKHKNVAIALAAAIGGALTIAVGAFAVNTGAKLVKSVTSAIDVVGKLATTISQKSTLISSSSAQVGSAAQTAATEVEGANADIVSSATTTATEVGTQTAQISEDAAVMATDVGGSVGDVQLSFDTLTSGAFAAQEDVQLAFAGIDEDVTEAALAYAAGARSIAESNLVIGSTTEAAAGKVALATGEEGIAGAAGAGALARTAGVGAGEAAIPEAVAETSGLAIAKGLVTGVAGKAIGGLIAVQLYNALLEKPIGKVIGQGAASALGDTATGAAIGFTIGGPLGAAAGGTIALAISQRKPIDKFFDPSHPRGTGTPSDSVLPAQDIALITNAAKAGANHPATISSATNRDNLLKSQIGYLQKLDGDYNHAIGASGINSAAAKSALDNLTSTENKWFPTLGKDTSVKGVDTKITNLHNNLDTLLGKQSFSVAEHGDIAATNAKLDQANAKLQDAEKNNASESTLKSARDQVKSLQDHLDQLKSLNAKIAKDQTAITQADKLKAEIQKVAQKSDQLRQEIANMPARKIVSTGTYKVKVTK